MPRHAGHSRGVRVAGMTLPVCPQRARDSRAPHGPRMGPHGPSSAYPLACVKWHAPPCSGMRAPCEASGRLGRHLPLVGGGPASAASRMGRAWARMGRAAPTLSVWATWHALPMQRHAGPMRGVRAAGPRLSVGPQRARVSRASHGPRMGPHGPSSADKRMHVLPMQRQCGPMRGVLVAGPRLSVGRWRARVSRGPHAPRMVPHGPMHEQERLDPACSKRRESCALLL